MTSIQTMQGKTVLITGATRGIGEITALELARLGARVVVSSRSPQRCAATVERIRKETGSSQVEFLAADLSIQSQVHQLAEQFLQRYDRLDVLVNNAGGFFMRRRETSDGIELTWALNHLSYFLLTNLLLERLAASAPARVVSVSSGAHTGGRINFDDPQGKHGYSGWSAYSQSKLANLLFTYELARRLQGQGVTANAVHPGFVRTGFAKNNGLFYRLGLNLMYFMTISPEEGARTSIYLASVPEVSGVSGKYFVKEREATSSPASYDEPTARRLWELSCQMTGL